MEIYRQVRVAVDPLDVVELLRGGDLLLQHSGPEQSGEGETPAAGLESLEQSALEQSSIKVSARPWTRIAGDGLVSELISSFFAYDNGFYLSFVDQESFLEDMQAGDVANSDFCSSVLVNAICALRCVSCPNLLLYSPINDFTSLLRSERGYSDRYRAMICANAFSMRQDACWMPIMDDVLCPPYRHC
jgi:hypothetical protein